MATAKKVKGKVTKPSMASRFPMNISQDLFDAWQKLRRTGDPKDICKDLNLSRPVIDRALNFGHVKNLEVTPERISKWFAKRIENEKKNPTPLGKASAKLVASIS